MKRPLSITGMGSISAAGGTVDQVSDAFFSTSIKTTQVPEQSLSETIPYFKIPVNEEWPQAKELGRPGLLPNLFALIAVQEAIDRAGLTAHDLNSLRIGVCLGSTVGGTNYQEDFWQNYFKAKPPSIGPVSAYFSSNSAQFISRHFGLRGPVLMVNNACTSGADAIGIGASWLEADLCDVVLCGGTETVLPKIYYGFRSLMLCSQTPCKPFDRTRTGLTLGEGAGIVVLEKTNTTRNTLARLVGYGTASDSFHPTAPHPEARGLGLAMKSALSEYGRNLHEIDFVNAHGTATPHNDLAEGRWIKKNLNQSRVVATRPALLRRRRTG
ncbi:MAG: beta-ketoacyl synthase N-terminal-like domain-containing protein, partial [Bdellovibrionota bacterium]